MSIGKLKEQLSIINFHNKEILDISKNLLSHLFTAIPDLNSIHIECNQEYNDNDYYTSKQITQINGYDFDFFSECFSEDENEDSDTQLNLLEEDEIELIIETIGHFWDYLNLEPDDSQTITRDESKESGYDIT